MTGMPQSLSEKGELLVGRKREPNCYMSISLREVFIFRALGLVKSGTTGQRIAWYILRSKLNANKNRKLEKKLTVACRSKDARTPSALKDVLLGRTARMNS